MRQILVWIASRFDVKMCTRKTTKSFSFFMRKLFSHHRRHVFFIIASTCDRFTKLDRKKLSRRATTYICVHAFAETNSRLIPLLHKISRFSFFSLFSTLVGVGELSLERIVWCWCLPFTCFDVIHAGERNWSEFVFFFFTDSFLLQLHHPPSMWWWQTIEKIPLVKCFSAKGI